MRRGHWKVLVVDDNLSDAVKVVRLVQHLGDHATLCLDGGDALLETEYDQFDLVILDWRMPGVSGRDFLKAVHWDRGSQDRPLKVLVYSGEPLSRTDFPTTSGRFDIVGVWNKSIEPAAFVRLMHRLKEAA